MVASEAVSNLAMNMAAPVFKGDAEEVEVTRKAEMEYREMIEEGLKETVFSNAYCTSVSFWYHCNGVKES